MTLLTTLKDQLATAYATGATDVHNHWAAGNVEAEPDFTEAAEDYASSVALPEIIVLLEREEARQAQALEGYADLIRDLETMYSHRGDEMPTQYVNPDGPEAIAVIHTLQAELAAVKADNERLDINAIHSCHDQCTRTACVLRRELAAVKAERDGLRERVASLFGAIEHGDLEHRAWLKDAITTHFAAALKGTG
jgi:FtsZ-binding cell division protein ZapB